MCLKLEEFASVESSCPQIQTMGKGEIRRKQLDKNILSGFCSICKTNFAFLNSHFLAHVVCLEAG